MFAPEYQMPNTIALRIIRMPMWMVSSFPLGYWVIGLCGTLHIASNGPINGEVTRHTIFGALSDNMHAEIGYVATTFAGDVNDPQSADDQQSPKIHVPRVDLIPSVSIRVHPWLNPVCTQPARPHAQSSRRRRMGCDSTTWGGAA